MTRYRIKYTRDDEELYLWSSPSLKYFILTWQYDLTLGKHKCLAVAFKCALYAKLVLMAIYVNGVLHGFESVTGNLTLEKFDPLIERVFDS